MDGQYLIVTVYYSRFLTFCQVYYNKPAATRQNPLNKPKEKPWLHNQGFKNSLIFTGRLLTQLGLLSASTSTPHATPLTGLRLNL